MTKRLKVSSVAAYTSLVILLLQLVLIVVSWVLTAVNPDIQIRSILGSEGLRWLFGTFVSNIASSFLVWMLDFILAERVACQPLVVDGDEHHRP